MSRRALITGASGFVGGFLAEHLLECGDAVIGCSPDGRWLDSSPSSLDGRVELVLWDLARDLDGPGRRRIADFRPDTVYHLAALSTPSECGDQEPTPLAVELNVGGTQRVLDLAAGLPSRPRVLVVSTNHVYGRPSGDAYRVSEDTPLAPQNAYAQTKLAAERQTHRAVEQLEADALIARAFQHTGPRQTASRILVDWARQFASGGSGPIQVHTCDAFLDLSDVRDVVRAYRLLMEHGARGEVYNVGSGVNRRSGDLLELMRGMADPTRPIVELHPGRKQEPIADVTRLVRLTGWSPAIRIEQTIADMLEWWRERVGGGKRGGGEEGKRGGVVP